MAYRMQVFEVEAPRTHCPVPTPVSGSLDAASAMFFSTGSVSTGSPLSVDSRRHNGTTASGEGLLPVADSILRSCGEATVCSAVPGWAWLYAATGPVWARLRPGRLDNVVITPLMECPRQHSLKKVWSDALPKGMLMSGHAEPCVRYNDKV